MSSHQDSSSAWYVVAVVRVLREIARLRGSTGASPKSSATFACASGEIMWSIQRYMQFGLAAFDEIIHVSDQPVVPSFGSIA